jgi:hypothetical protein
VGVPGLVLAQDGADAVVSGTPTTAGTFTATVEVRQAWDSPTGPARSTWQVPITVVASGGNMRPVCEGGATTATQGGGFATMVDCTDPDGDPLTYAIATLPAHGTLEMISADTFEYTAPTDYLGPDPWTFTASDGALTSEPATFMVTVAEAGGCTSYGTDGDDYVEVVADGEWYCGGAGNDTVGLVALGAVFDGGDGDDWVVRNEAQVFGQEGADGIRDNLGSFLGATGADYVVWNEGYFSGDDDADWVTDNFGSVEGGPGDDHVDTNWPEGEFYGGEGIDTVDDNQGIFDPGPQ